MKIFMKKLKDLIGTQRHPQSWAPLDLLFEAQRPFLEKNFFHEGIRGHKVTVEVDPGPGLITFRCELSLRSHPYDTVSRIVEGDWGDFEVRKVTFASADADGKNYDWLKATFMVGLRGGK